LIKCVSASIVQKGYNFDVHVPSKLLTSLESFLGMPGRKCRHDTALFRRKCNLNAALSAKKCRQETALCRCKCRHDTKAFRETLDTMLHRPDRSVDTYHLWIYRLVTRPEGYFFSAGASSTATPAFLFRKGTTWS